VELTKINLQILIIFWWVGAIAAGSALSFPIYQHYLTVGTVGWTIIGVTTGLIIYEIKRIKEEDKKKNIP
jgi:hypothetical protein